MKFRWPTVLAALLAPVLAHAQTRINPNSQINWPAVTGAVAPTGACTILNYGQPYTNSTTGQVYTCTGLGWSLQTTTLPYPGIVWATSALSGTVATSTQVQGVIGASVYDPFGSAAAVLASSAQKANNLSDLANAATARTNLDLGTMATQSSSAVAITGGTALLSALTTNATQTTTSCSTSGTVVFSEPMQGPSDKKVAIYLYGCIGTASYAYPVAFTVLPSVYGSEDVPPSVASALTTTSVTITLPTAITGSLAIEAY